VRLKEIARARRISKAYKDSDSDRASSLDSFTNDYEIPWKVL